MSIRIKLLAVAVLPILLALLVWVILSATFGRVQEARHQGLLANRIVQASMDLSLLTHEYAERPADRPAEQWWSKHGSIARLLGRIDPAGPAIRQSLGRARRAHQAMAELFTRLADAVQDPSGVRDAVIAQFRRRMVAQLLSKSQELVSLATVLAQANDRRETALLERANVLVVACVLGAGVLALVVSLLVAGSILGPLRTLRAGTERIAQGEFDHRVPIDRGDEIGQLADAFNAMTGRLKTTTVSRDELEAAVNELTRSNQELEQFAYVASHDLQEPLRKISAFGNLLKRKYGEQLPEQGQEFVDFMQDAAERMSRLIADLLTFSRVSTRAKPFEQVDLGQVIDEVQRDLQTRIEETGGRVEAGPMPTLEAEPFQMRQVFQNLIANALKFHREEAPPTVRIASEEAPPGPHGPQCRITVADNGIGFDPKHADRIFGVFQRLHTREEYEGTGIGLAVCRKIIQRHHGTISASGEPGRGTTFTITMPLAQPAERTEP